MHTCTYCGKELPEGAQACPVDGTPVLDPNAPVALPTVNPRVRKPIFGMLSVSLPLVAGLLVLAGLMVDVIGIVFFVFFVIPPTIVPGAGIVFAVISMARRERWGSLPVVGLVLNLLLLLWIALAPRDNWHM